MNVLALFSPIKVFIFDIDGVLTDGRLLVTEDGTLLRSMNVKDGFALQWAARKGYQVVVISGGHSKAAKIRLEKLGLDKVFISVSDKADLLSRLMMENGWRKNEMLYMGDDLPDVDGLRLCGLATCPGDAVPEIKNRCAYVSPYNGGQGCVRDVIEKVLKLQGEWPEL